MKKYLLTLTLAVSTALAFSQVDSLDQETPFEDPTTIQTEEVIPDYSEAEKALKQLEDASEDLQKANEELTEARSQYKEAENKVEAARLNFRQARRAANEAKKRENPYEIPRYQVNVNPILEDMSKGTNYGYSVFLEGSEGGGLFNLLSKNAESEFKKFMSEYKAGRVRKTKGELFFDNILIPQISSYNMDVYADFVKQDNGVNILTYWNIGDGFINGTSESAADDAVRDLMDKFARYMRQLELTQKLRDQEKERDKIQKDIEKARDNASDAREDIQKSEQDILKAISEEEEKELLLEQQMDKLELTRKKLDSVN